MTCEKYFDLIQDLLEDELDEHLSEKAESHIFACRKCRERYETLRRAKEIYAQYLFDAEPPSDSWANFQARLVSENDKSQGDSIIPVSVFRRIKRRFAFSFSPTSAAAALAALLFVCGIGFLWLQTISVEKDGDEYAGEMETRSLPSPTQSRETVQSPAPDLQAKTVADDVPKNNGFLAKNKSLKARSNSFLTKKSPAAEPMKINQKPAFSTVKRKSASESRSNEEKPLPALQAQNLEIEIAEQIEKVELLLRSFRNARSNETINGFDVEYEKRQARKLLGKNELLKRNAENYGLVYAEELLSRVETYLLEIANLESKPSTESVLDIKDRVSSQNIIASLQAYNRDAVQ